MSQRSHLTIATAGHIDHGKSTLVQALTGVHPDRLKEEQARGISIELGFAHADIGDVRVSFVDVPGHERFVRHMLAGIGGIDGVLFVVASDESVMPQTREHLAIATLLGVPRGVIALTKADLVDADLRGLVRLELEEVLAGTPLATAPIVEVSGTTGEGLEALRAALVSLASQGGPRDERAPARLPVDRVFTVRGFGTVVTGTLWTGHLRVDEEVTVLPGGGTWRVRGLQVHGVDARDAVAGQRVAVNLAGAGVTDLSRGDVLAAPGGLVVTRRIDARLHLLPDAPPLRHGARVHLHLGTSETLARVSLLRAPTGDGGDALDPGATAWVRLRLERPLPTRYGDRFVIRSYSPVATIAGGQVVDPLPPRRTSRASAGARLDTWAALAGDESVTSLAARLTHLAHEARLPGLEADTLAARLGTSPDVVEALVSAAAAAGSVVTLGAHLASPGALDVLRADLLAHVDAHHQAEPTSDGVPRQSLRERLGRRGATVAVDHVVEALVAAGAVVVTDDRLARRDHLAGRTALATATAQVRQAAAQAGLGAVTIDDLRAASGLDAAGTDAVVRHLVRDEHLLKSGTLYVDADAVKALAADLRAEQAAGGLQTVDVGWFKERYGLTRRTAIPLLELLDRLRVTRRVGESRVLVAP